MNYPIFAEYLVQSGLVRAVWPLGGHGSPIIIGPLHPLLTSMGFSPSEQAQIQQALGDLRQSPLRPPPGYHQKPGSPPGTWVPNFVRPAPPGYEQKPGAPPGTWIPIFPRHPAPP